MSKYLNNTNLMCKRLLSVLGVVMVSAFSGFPLVEAFQVRQADNLRVMQSKPYAESANFRVNADMFIQPSLKIRSSNLVAQSNPTPSVTPTVPDSSGGSVVTSSPDNDGGEKYDASDWILSRKYEELVRGRDGEGGSFLTSAPEDPELRFDYLPTDPRLVETLEYDAEDGEPSPIEVEAAPEADSVVPMTPAVETPTFDNAVFKQDVFQTSTGRAVQEPTAEQILISAPVAVDDVMVVQLTTKQKRDLMKTQAEGFYWPWENRSEKVFEAWQSAAPSSETAATPNCVNCEDVLWWSWCQFVVITLILILILVLINTLLQILMFRYRLDKYQPDNPKSFKYRLKKFLQSIGLMSLALVSVSSFEAHAQTTTSPQLLIYEGELLDDLGNPAAGSFTFRFSFWDNADYEATDVAGGVINAAAPDYRGWSEVQTTSTLADGSFSLRLSEVSPFTAGLFDQNNLFLQVEVKNAGDPDTAYEFVDIDLGDATVDRKVIASVPFAFNANKLDYRELGFGSGNIPYLDLSGLLPESVIPDLNLTADDLDLTDITLSDFTNDLALNDGQVLVGDATNTAAAVTISGDGTLDNSGVFTLAVDSVGEDELDFGNITLADFTNDAGFLTTVDVSDNTNLAAGAGATLTDDTISVNVGDTIESSEITDGTITSADLDLADITLTDFTNDAGFITSDADTLGGLACAANEIAKWNGTAWICAPDAGGAAFTASDGITLTGSNFTNDFGTTIEGSEITDGTIGAADLNFGDITLADFTNDAGFLTAESQDLSLVGTDLSITGGSTIDLSGFGVDAQTLSLVGTDLSISGGNTLDIGSLDTDTTYTGSGGITLTGTNFTADLGTSVDSAEIVDGTIVGADLNFGDITLSDFTNDAGFITTDNDTTYTGSGGITLTGTNFTADLGTSIDASEIDTDAVGDDEIDYAAVTLSDFANDVGFITSDSDTLDALSCASGEIAKWNGSAWACATDGGNTYVAGTGLSLTGDTFSVDLGTDISTAEIQDNAVTVAKIGTAGATDGDKILTTDGVGNPQWEDKSNFLDSNLTSGQLIVGNGANVATAVTLSGDATLDETGALALVSDSVKDDEIDYSTVTLADFTNDAGFITTDNDTTYNAGIGLNLVGTTFSTTLGTSIDSSEIDNGTIGQADLNFGDITLADFTNDAGFLTTVDISANTNLVAGDGVTLTGDTLSANLGSSVVSAEIVDGTVADEDLNLTDITLADFTNDVGYVTTDNDTTYTAGTGLALIGTTFSSILGSTIDSAEIDTNAVKDDEIDYTNVTLADFTNDAGFLTTVDISSNTNLSAGAGLTLVGDSIISDLGASISTSEIENGTISDADLDLSDITLADFTNDAGFLTSEVDGSTTNEIQDLNLAANTLSLSGDATTVDLTPYLDNTDEQDLTLTGNTLSLTGDASTVDLSVYLDDTDTTYTAGTGMILTGTTFEAELGNSIDATEINTNAVGDDEINYSTVTLADFTNDAGFLTAESQDISLSGTDLSITGGSTIDLSVIDTDTDTLGSLSCASGELAKWDGSSWYCAADDGGSTFTASDGITLTGSNFTNDLGVAIDTGEIVNGTIEDEDLNLTDITLADFTNDAGFLTSDTLQDLTCATDEVAQWNGSAWVCAGGATNVTEVLAPRYPGSIFEADGTNNTGSMFEEEEMLSSGIINTILRWFSRQTVFNDYDTVIMWTVPDDFVGFQSPAIALDYQTTGLVTDAKIDMTVARNNDGSDEILAAGIGLNNNFWTNATFTLDGTTTWGPGDTLKIRFKTYAKDSNSAKLGNVKINYIKSQVN